MDWTQTLTIILTIVGSMLAVWYAFYYMIKEDINLVREDLKRHDVELTEMRQEFSKVHNLWADLLKQIYEIKLDQSRKTSAN
ncbi:MAG: hypothetical protein FJX18_05800 [Alphaproteobacteria bacterium]|nr:hypothetical protein [Alphaproteobacteria bacterium]